MKRKKFLLHVLALVACLMCALGAKAVEAYACYTPSNTTLTFYYDNQRSSRSGTTYDLNTGDNNPVWHNISNSVTKVVFNSSFASARPTTTRSWFLDMTSLQSISGTQYLNTSEVTNMNFMFCGAGGPMTSLNTSFLNTAKVTTMKDMFSFCGFSSLNVSSLNTANVTNMMGMFSYCYNLTTLDLSGWNTANVTDMSEMFRESEALESINLNNWNTSNVTNMSMMFWYCSALTSLDLGSFNTAKVTQMDCMFYDCGALQTICVGSGWSTTAVTDSEDMFEDCTRLVGGMGTTYDANHVDAAYAHIDGGTANPGYFTAGVEAYACYTSSNTTLTFYYDNLRSRRSGTTYDLNTGKNSPAWYNFDTNASATRVVFDSSFANARPTTTLYWFRDMTKLTTITGMKQYLNTSEVTDMACMFFRCNKLTSLDVSGFNTANVTNMVAMFSGCSSLTSLDVSGFNTANVTTMHAMFESCSGLTSLDLSGFNTANVTEMYEMFCYCSNLKTIYAGSDWSTAAVYYDWSMFYGCTSLVGGQGTTYNDSNPRDKTYAHIDGGTANPGYFTDPNAPVAYACYTPSNTTLTFYYDSQRSSRSGTTYDLNEGDNDTGWDTDGTNADVTKVVFDPSFTGARPTTTYDWFFIMVNLESITGMEYLNTSEVTNMAYMFAGCKKLTTLDVSHFNTSKVTSMINMFRNCNNLQTIYAGSGWSTTAVTDSEDMFYNCTSLVGGQGTTYNASHVDASYAHIDGGTANPGYLTEFKEAYACYTPSNTTLTFYYDSQRYSREGTTYSLNIRGSGFTEWFIDNINDKVTKVVFNSSFSNARPTTTYGWFYKLTNLTTITGMSYLNTSEVTNMKEMFRECTSLTNIDLSNFNTANVTDMSSMFAGCSSLEVLDLSGFNTANVTDMQTMFYECENLTSLDLSNFNTAKVTDMYFMFGNCKKLQSLDLGSFNTANVNNMERMFSHCGSLTILDLSSFNTANVNYTTCMFENCSNLNTIYVSGNWSMAAIISAYCMFVRCTSLVGGQGTTYDFDHIDKTYAHIDGGPSNPGYFTEKNAGLRGDVNGDGIVNISDVTALIDYLLSGNASGVNQSAADCNRDTNINISDVTALIDYLLSGTWN